MPKSLVTGGAGFIGSHLVDALVKKGHQVLIIDDLSTGTLKNVSKKAKLVQLPVNSSKVPLVIKKFKPDYVFHLAAQIKVPKSIEDPAHDAKVNIIGGLNILQAALDAKVKKFIFTSSGGGICPPEAGMPAGEVVDIDPPSPYGITKFAFEKYLSFYKSHHDLDYIALRLSNVYGPRQVAGGEGGVIAFFCDSMRNNLDVVIHGNGEQTRDFIYVSDVVNAALKAASSKKVGVFNVSTQKEASVNDIFKTISKIVDYTGKMTYNPSVHSGVCRSVLKNKTIKRDLSWTPKVDLLTGLKKTINWYTKGD